MIEMHEINSHTYIQYTHIHTHRQTLTHNSENFYEEYIVYCIKVSGVRSHSQFIIFSKCLYSQKKNNNKYMFLVPNYQTKNLGQFEKDNSSFWCSKAQSN